MRRVSAILCILLTVAACGGSSGGSSGGGDGPDVPVQSTDSSIAGKTLSCQAGGPPSDLTFGPDGTISGRLLGTDVTGRWYVNEKSEVHTHVVAGPVSLRDNLRQVGNRWVGKTTTCTG